MRWSKLLVFLCFAFAKLHTTDAQGRAAFNISDSGLILQLLSESEFEKITAIKKSKASDAYLYSKNVGFERGQILSLKMLIQLNQQQNENIEALRYCFNLIPLMDKLKHKELSDYYEITGDLYTTEKVYNKGIEYYQLACSVRPGNSENTQRKIINNALISGSYAAAIESLNKLLLLEAKAEIYEQLGFCHQQLNQKSMAIANYQKALLLPGANKSLIENNIGYLEFENKNYSSAISHFNLAVKSSTGIKEKLNALTNLSIANQKAGNIEAAIASLNQCIALTEKEYKHSKYQQLLADVYLNKGDVYSALTFSNLALTNAYSDKRTQAGAYLTRAQAYQKIFDFEGALSNYKSYLKLNDSILLQDIAEQQNINQKSIELQKLEKELKETLLNDQIKFLTIQQLQLEGEKLKLNSEKLTLEAAKRDAEIITLKREQEVKEERLKNIALENDKNRQKLALAAQEILNNNIKSKLEILKQQEEKQRLELINKEAEEKQRLQQISLLERDKKIGILEKEKQKDFRRNTILGAIVALGLIVLAGVGYFLVRNKNKVLAKQNIEIENKNKLIAQNHEIIEAEKHKSDGLLLNILPEKIADELKETGVSKPVHFDMVSIIFTDFVKFTQYSERVSNERLIGDLNTIFQSFDEIIDDHNLEKIKTIGDSYMCAGGLPIPNTSNPYDAVLAAIKMRNYIDNFNSERTVEDQLKIRIGINTGPCVAGVVGKRKFAYDIWGDAVNTAARMEQSGEAGKINISENTYNLIKSDFDCDYRGMVDAKNKGKIKMYFVEMRGKRNSE